MSAHRLPTSASSPALRIAPSKPALFPRFNESLLLFFPSSFLLSSHGE
ncbi:predicted protein [Plenodomus lingam JN3]|uniref:Predicted protein n=1 Tax=Leptosphaeria maculans (strain JN3 / isolate v23.1.3 / race Av1-4-5-6-7-8) TaxID=985895 RepID=E4ZHS3_LEPMJ|nr:predicted protein [Plenodomus lingam JN3]CBX90906.1 predicted protein [Plenodomus lingam JN3]